MSWKPRDPGRNVSSPQRCTTACSWRRSWTCQVETDLCTSLQHNCGCTHLDIFRFKLFSQLIFCSLLSEIHHPSSALCCYLSKTTYKLSSVMDSLYFWGTVKYDSYVFPQPTSRRLVPWWSQVRYWVSQRWECSSCPCPASTSATNPRAPKTSAPSWEECSYS